MLVPQDKETAGKGPQRVKTLHVIEPIENVVFSTIRFFMGGEGTQNSFWVSDNCNGILLNKDDNIHK